jgi:hypothetical protein
MSSSLHNSLTDINQFNASHKVHSLPLPLNTSMNPIYSDVIASLKASQFSMKGQIIATKKLRVLANTQSLRLLRTMCSSLTCDRSLSPSVQVNPSKYLNLRLYIQDLPQTLSTLQLDQLSCFPNFPTLLYSPTPTPDITRSSPES